MPSFEKYSIFRLVIIYLISDHYLFINYSHIINLFIINFIHYFRHFLFIINNYLVIINL